MKELIRVSFLLTIVALWAGVARPLWATTIFDNSAHDLVTRFAPGTNEVGDEILLTGPERYLTNFSFEFWGTNTANPAAFSGINVEARVRFYQNNGPPFHGYPTPGANFYDSGWFPIDPTPRSTEIFTAGTDFPWTGLFLPVISNMTWSVQFRGMGATDSVGVDIYSPPVVGHDYPDYWENDGGAWILKTNISGVHMDFAAKMDARAQPQPGVNPYPPWLTNVVSGSNLILSWPSDHIGWMLQVQTNAPGVGITANWHTITGSSTTNLWTLPIDPANGSVFSRLVYQLGQLFSDDFTRTTDPGPLAPWVTQAGTWAVTGGLLAGGPNAPFSYGHVYITNSWYGGDYSAQAQFRFPAGAYGGGLGGRLNPATGSHYAAWVYPETSPGGAGVLNLLKFQTWSSYAYTNSAVPMAQVNLPTMGTNWHTIKMVFQGAQITVYYDTNQVMSVTDVEAQPYLSGGVSLDYWTDATAYRVSMDNVVVNALQ